MCFCIILTNEIFLHFFFFKPVKVFPLWEYPSCHKGYKFQVLQNLNQPLVAPSALNGSSYIKASRKWVSANTGASKMSFSKGDKYKMLFTDFFCLCSPLTFFFSLWHMNFWFPPQHIICHGDLQQHHLEIMSYWLWRQSAQGSSPTFANDSWDPWIRDFTNTQRNRTNVYWILPSTWHCAQCFCMFHTLFCTNITTVLWDWH